MTDLSQTPFPTVRSGRRPKPRPGSVGGVAVRAPLLDPTRTPTGPRPDVHRRREVEHPKLEKRRRSIRRSARWVTWRRWFTAGGVLTTLGFGVLVALASPLFAVKTVAITFSGSSTQTADIESVTNAMRGKNLIRLNVDGRVEALRSLPWVATASVHRRFPNTVAVTVLAHDLAGAVELIDGRVALAATDGSVLSVVSADDPSVAGLPRFELGLRSIPVAGDSLAEPAAAVMASAASFERRGAGRLQRVVLADGEVTWIVRPHPGDRTVRVDIGTPRESDVPAAALTSVLARRGPTLRAVDLRAPDTPVLELANRSAKR